MVNKHSYAQDVLRKSNISIYAGASQILNSSSEVLHNFGQFKSQWTLHKHISIDNKQTKTIERYDDLLKMGFQISRRRVQGSYFRGQRVEYFLVKSDGRTPHMGVIPPEHKVEFNFVENWIRLIGRNSRARKIYIKQLTRGKYHKEMQIGDYADAYEQYFQDIYPYTLEQVEEEKIEIPEIPLIVTSDGSLVCLPLTKDTPTIGIFGKRGGGKTLFLHGLGDRFYHKWNKRIFPCNDGISLQTRSWSLPWEGKEFVKVAGKTLYFVDWLKQIGEETRPLPITYLYPNTSDLKRMEFENEIGYKISLPFRDIMEDPNSLFAGTSEQLGASEKYLKNLIYDNHGNIRPDGLLYVKNIEDIERLVNEKIWIENEKERGGGQKLIDRMQVYAIENEKVRGKIFNLLKEVFKEKIFDINTEIPSKWILEKYEEKTAMYPWSACLCAEIVPVLVTERLRNTKYFGSYMRFMLNDLFKMQSEDEIIKRNKLDLWILPDEIQSILSHPPALEAFTKIFKEGRYNRIGVAYATQWIGDIPEPIKLNTDYVVAFQQNSEEAKEIASNFDFLRHEEKDIVLLKKFHAVVAGKAGSKLVVYDTEGNKEIIDDGTPFRGLIFPSVSQHSAPKEEGI